MLCISWSWSLVFHHRLYYDAYNNGGQWLNAVFLTGHHQQLTGFVHAEDHFWVPGQGWAGNGRAYKSVALGKQFVSSYFVCLILIFSVQ